LGTDSQSGWDSLQGRVPVGTYEEFFRSQFVAGEIDFEVKISLESSEVLLQLYFCGLRSRAEIKAEA
jgi:hypothetical protein